MDKKYNIPEIRFKGFTEGWKENKFEDIFIFSTGKNIKQKEASPEFKIPCIRYGELYHMYGEVISTVINRTNIDATELLFSKGDEILLPSAGEDPLDIGSASALTIKNIAIGRTINILRPKNSEMCSHIFLSYYINQNLRREISSLAKGVSISNVYNSDLKTLRAKLPSIQEQKQIGTFFQNLDNLITLHQKKYDKLVILKKAMLVKMFPKNGALLPEIRFKGFTENWKREILSELGDFKSNGVDKKIISTEHPVNLLNYMDVYNSRYLDANNCKGLMQVTAKTSQLNDNNVLKNDVFFTPSSETSEDIGRVMVIENDLPNTVYSYHLMRFRPKLNVFYTFFPNYCFASEHVRKQLVLSAQGVQRFTLSKPAFEELTVLIPSLKEQQKIGDYFKNLDNQIALNKTQLKKLNNIKKACFSKMFVAQD